MIKEEYIVALDIGSSTIRTLVVQAIPDGTPRVIGVGIAQSNGMRRGSVVDIEEVTNSIKDSLAQAELNSGVRIQAVYLSVGGAHIKSSETKGVIAVGRADGEVNEDDVERVIEASQTMNLPPNEEILHVIPQKFKLDEHDDIKDPVGMSGVRLEMQGLMVTGISPQIKNLFKCVESLGVQVDGVIVAPLAAAKAVLNKRQKELGVAVVDIGGGTTSLAVYEERQLIHLGVIPVGADHITNDVAIGLRTSIEVAEKVKLHYGSALVGEIKRDEQIDLSKIDPNEEGVVPRQHVAEIIEARVEEIFYLVEKELKRINRSALLPAGVVLVGGGACTPGMVDLAKDILALPAQTGFPKELSGLVDKIETPSFAVPVGMILWLLEAGEEGYGLGQGGGFSSGGSSSFLEKFGKVGGALKKVGELLKKVLP